MRTLFLFCALSIAAAPSIAQNAPQPPAGSPKHIASLQDFVTTYRAPGCSTEASYGVRDMESVTVICGSEAQFHAGYVIDETHLVSRCEQRANRFVCTITPRA